MANKNVMPIFIVVVLGMSLVIVLPNFFLSASLSSYGTIYKSESYAFPEYLSPNVDLNIVADVGNIKIEYVEPSNFFYGKIDVNFNIGSSDLAGKSFTDYFFLDWQTTNSSANFTLELLSETWFDPSLWSIQDVNIVISLRMDITFDIMATVDKGNFEIVVPYRVSIGSLRTNLSKGTVFYDFQSCTIEGNITGITNEGNLKLKSYNVEYTQNSNWMLNTTGGDMDVEISQYKEMGANLTGIAVITTGNLRLFYNDTTADIGALFVFPKFPLGFTSPQEGFNIIFQGAGLSHISSDFPTMNNYNLTFYLPGQRQGCSIELHSD